jgi:hypothetical protein
VRFERNIDTVIGTAKIMTIRKQEVREAQRIVNPLPRLMTIKQASQFLGLTTWALRERIWSGQLPVVTFPGGKKQYLDRDDLDGFIQRNKRTIDA